jgi:beta-N-acetylhexosaminidase
MTTAAPIVLDVAGTTLSAADRRRLKHPLVGGVILFARNWTDRAQLTALTASIKAVRSDLLIAVDHEGGRVMRFRGDGFTAVPAMRRLGEAWMKDPMAALASAVACGYVLASELRACGVDLSLAPVLDLDHGGSRVIGDRAFHRDPRVVTMLAQSVMHGLLRAGMAHCAKHFPGHGHVAADSHVDIPIDRRSLKAVLQDDAQPFAWMASHLQAVMPAHIIFPKVDARPAGFSARWLQEVLRQRLGFDGAIFSDDLSMAAARVLEGRSLSFTEAALAALTAGCDLVLLCNQSVDGGEAVDALIDGLAQAQASGVWQPSADSEHRRMRMLPQTVPLPWDELMHETAYQLALERLP